jgi:cobalt-zinc-cadmium efflux system outer membrane protein
MSAPRSILTLGLAAMLLPVTGHAVEKGKVFAPVADAVKARTGRDVRWEEDGDARAENLRSVRALLKQPLNAGTATQIALLNNRGLQATFEEIGVSAADLREAGAWKNPTLDLSFRFPDRPPSSVNAEEAVIFNLLDLFMIPLRKRVAAEHLQAAQLRVADEALKLVAEVKSAVYRLQADEQLIGRLKLVREAGGAALDLAQKQHEAGNITDLALMQQQTSYSQARLEVAMAEAEMREHREKLNRLLGVWGADTDWKVSGQLPPLPESDPALKGLESLAVTQRLDLAAAQAELGGVVRALGLTKAYRFVGALEFGIDTERETDRTNVTGPRMSVELPLFNQGQARVARAQAELRRAERKFEALAIEIRSEVRELHDRLASKHEIARFYHDELLPGRIAIVNQSLLYYNGMLLGNYELFTVKAEELHAERGYVEALRDYWIARAELERAIGGSFTTRSSSDAKMAMPPKPVSTKNTSHQH